MIASDNLPMGVKVKQSGGLAYVLPVGIAPEPRFWFRRLSLFGVVQSLVKADELKEHGYANDVTIKDVT